MHHISCKGERKWEMIRSHSPHMGENVWKARAEVPYWSNRSGEQKELNGTLQ